VSCLRVRCIRSCRPFCQGLPGWMRSCRMRLQMRRPVALKHRLNARKCLYALERVVLWPGVKGNTSKLSPDGSTSDFVPRRHPYDDPLPIIDSSDRVSRLKRYKLVEVQEGEAHSLLNRIQKRQGSVLAPAPGAHFRSASRGGFVDPYHPVKQKALMIALREQFGARNVTDPASSHHLPPGRRVC
jgi:hypothetical protein